MTVFGCFTAHAPNLPESTLGVPQFLVKALDVASKWPLRKNLLYLRHLPDVSLPDQNASVMDRLC